MKKNLLLGLILISSASVFAETKLKDFYIRADSGISIPAKKAGSNNAPFLEDSKFKNSALYGVGVGYKFNDFLRSDVNLQYRNMHYKHRDNREGSVKQDTKGYAIFWNGYLDAKNSTIITPFLTGGIGYSRLNPANAVQDNTFDIDSYPSRSTNNFAWNLGAGSKISVTNNVDLDLTYRYVSLGKLAFGNPANFGVAGKRFSLRNHEVTLGVAYNF